MIKKHKFSPGFKRIKSIDFKFYEKKIMFWKKLKEVPKSAKLTIDLFSHYNNSYNLIDDKDKNFLVGHITPDDKVSGSRLKLLPSGKELARGGYSIFSKNLKFNLSNDNDLSWDVCFENESGSKTYLYSIDKIHLEQEQKFELVKKFDEFYEEILEKIDLDIKRFEDKRKYLGLYTLIKSKIRVGNFEYFSHSGHKGLTTLMKKDLILNKKNNTIIFDFIGKDGVPQNIIVKFPKIYILYFEELLSKIKKNDFVFSNKNGHPIDSVEFSKLLFKYTGVHFYPHIIRSYFADKVCMDFLKDISKKKIKVTKEDVENKFDEIAIGLGHKKYDKKNDIWKINHKVTIDSYIYPKLSNEMLELYLDKN